MKLNDMEWCYVNFSFLLSLKGNTDYHDENGRSQGVDSFGSTLHFGPVYGYDPYEKAHEEMQVFYHIVPSI